MTDAAHGKAIKRAKSPEKKAALYSKARKFVTKGKYKHGENDIPIIGNKLYYKGGGVDAKDIGDGSLIFNPEQRKRISKAKGKKAKGKAIMKAEATWRKHNTD